MVPDFICVGVLSSESGVAVMERIRAFFAAILLYFREVVAELRKVAWPSWVRTLRLTGVVLGMVLGISLFMFVLDFALGAGAERLLGR